MAKTAIYHAPDGSTRELTVSREHAKKNPKDAAEVAYVDLVRKETDDDGKEKDVLDIGKCPVSDTPKVGHCTIVGASAKKVEADDEKDPSRAPHSMQPHKK